MKKELNEKDVLTMADIGMELQHGHISIIEARDRKYIKQSRLREAVEGLKEELCEDRDTDNPINKCLTSDPTNEDNFTCSTCQKIDRIFGGALKDEKSKEMIEKDG